MKDEKWLIKKQITHEISALEEEVEGANIITGGLIEVIRKIFTKNKIYCI